MKNFLGFMFLRLCFHVMKALAYFDIAASKDFLASEMVTLSKTSEEKLEKIATQRLLANYTNG